jgi:hypothetical protein
MKLVSYLEDSASWQINRGCPSLVDPFKFSPAMGFFLDASSQLKKTVAEMPIVKHMTEGQRQRKNNKRRASTDGLGNRLCYHEIMTADWRIFIKDYQGTM